jgi:hypothetical protein
METQDWVGKQIDKDLLLSGNKCYSPDTCVFISPQLNKFLQDAFSNKRDGGVKGYYFDKWRGKFVAQCSDHTTGKLKHLGMFIEESDDRYLQLRFCQERKHLEHGFHETHRIID